MNRFLMIVIASLGWIACSDDGAKEEPLIILPGTNNNTGSNNANNTIADNNTTGETNNGTTPIEQPPREEIVELLDTELTTGFDGNSVELTFEVPENTISVMVVAVGEYPTYWTLSGWRNGDDSAVVTPGWINSDQGSPSLCLSCPQRISASDGAFAAILPGNPNVAVVPGTHKVNLYSFVQSGFSFSPGTHSAQVQVFARVEAAEPTTGVLDMNLWFTGAEGWTAETAKTDQTFQNMLAEVNRVYAQVNVELGNITYNDVEGDYRVIENLIRSSTDLAEMFEQSARAPQDAVNVFFVDELLQGNGPGGFGVILGISGGIPGPANMVGTSKNGVAIAVKPNPQAPSNPAHVMAHEVGHYLGLFHTSEQNFGGGQQIHDQLADTPENNMTYLMHNSGAGTTLSPNQGRTMRLNHWMRTGDAQ